MNGATCVLHLDRNGNREALGHRLCDECFDAYRVERREQQSFRDRVFLQQILRAGYDLDSVVLKELVQR